MCNYYVRTFFFFVCFVVLFNLVLLQNSDKSHTDHFGGLIQNSLTFSRDKSPYLLTNDLIIDRSAELRIEPGVTVQIQPQVGITVRGSLIAEGTENERITFTTADETSAKTLILPDIRLVDGPSILAGRVQIKHKNKWRSVCTNSKNWTVADMETACRQLGFQGGAFFNWMNRQMPVKPRLLYEEPNCLGTENSLLDCKWNNRQLGSGVCDYHPDIGIECQPRHDKNMGYWRGLKFEFADNKDDLVQHTRYVPVSYSSLHYVNIQYAGAGRDQNASSALEIEGIPPKMQYISILNSAYNAINITKSNAEIKIKNCTLINNRGYGIFINSSYGEAHIDGCTINNNGGDGVRFVHAEERPEERADRYGYQDFCQFAMASSQTFPIQLFAEQTIFLQKEKQCTKAFTARYGNVLTLNFIRAVTDRNESASIEIYDGSAVNHRLINKFNIRNNTRPQSLTSTSNQMFVKFAAQPFTEMVIFMRIVSGPRKAFDVNVSYSDISENLGRGIAVDNLRSHFHVYKSSVSKNEHVAGVHVTSGVGDVNITESKISFNEGDGINITYTGGSRNISKSSVSSNKGYGIAIWLNNTEETEYLFANQTTVLQYTEIVKNLDVGVLHGNYCGDAFFNISGNTFKSGLSDALEIQTCWKRNVVPTKLQIGHNMFLMNERLSLKLYPAVNLDANIEFNNFRVGLFGQLLIKNELLERFNDLSTKINVQQNYFLNNSGIFVANLALSPYALNQNLLFTRNFVKNNRIKEPFQSEEKPESNLNPRSRVAAPIVVGSDNVIVYRNIISNPDSLYEIGSHLEDQSKSINCSYNWLGDSSDEIVQKRLFHRTDRYNLAKILYQPFLLHNSNPFTTKWNSHFIYVPQFISSNTNTVGGEVEGEEIIPKGEYFVEKDINIRPGGKLTIEPGVVLNFPPSIGMLVGGKLEARGIAPDSIKFTLKQSIVHQPDNESYVVDDNQQEEFEILDITPELPIRLVGGNSEFEGKLQIKINNQWGTVCNYGWTIKNAALACQQLGYVLNPEDWYIERKDLPSAGTSEKVILSNVQCDDFDTDIRKCRSETVDNFENSCSHENDVGIRCYETSWAGIRFGPLSERSDIQYITIEKAGLLDYATNTFKPALQLDFARHNFENVKITNNYFHGLGVMYSNIYTDDSVNTFKNCEISENKGAGLEFKQLGFNVYGCVLQKNVYGIKHDPTLTSLQQRELAGWFLKNNEDISYNPVLIPSYTTSNDLYISKGETKYIVTEKSTENLSKSYKIRCDPGWVIGIQLLNPIENRSSEYIKIYDAITHNELSTAWVLKRDLTVFPTTSSAHGIVIDYRSGEYAIGGTVIVLSTIRAPVQNVYNRIVKGPIPTLTVQRTKIKQNKYGIFSSYYNRYLDELGNHFLRKSNETLKFINCEISFNEREAIFTHSPNWDLHNSNLSEIVIMVNSSLITDNGKGIYQFSRDMRASNNLYHYVLQDNTVERNKAGGFDISLPYVWRYNENFTHSIYMDNNTWTNNKKFEISIDGHYASVNITRSRFEQNQCKTGLLAIKGMEKALLIRRNIFSANNGQYIIKFSSNSQSEIIGNVPALFYENELNNNKYVIRGRGGSGILQLQETPTSVVSFKGIQKVLIRRNLFNNNYMKYQLIAGIRTAKINNFLDIKENWWGTNIEEEIIKQIFDFDDWNDHAIAEFRPYLTENKFESSISVSYNRNTSSDSSKLGGRLYEDLVLSDNGYPYTVESDITVMPKTTLTINPGVIMEFAPNVGILVLGSLMAKGYKGSEITMRPLIRSENLQVDESISRNKREIEPLYGQESIRLCQSRSCASEDIMPNEGFLEYFNMTTLQWIPLCDARFTERNAQVVCRELGFDPLNAFFDHGIRIDFHSNLLSRIWTWPEPLQCQGTEKRFEDCPIRLNGQQFGHRHRCHWNSEYVFISCESRNKTKQDKYWGGVRFADAEFEQQLYTHRIHDAYTHTTRQPLESIMEYVNVIGAGILHNEKSPAIQSVIKSPKINYCTVRDSAFHGIDLISPSNTMVLLNNEIKDTMGVGINIVSLSGEGRESDESSFTPLKALNIPYNLFSLVDICDTNKEIKIEERVLIYYKYDNHPVNCIKIFRSAYNIKPLGFRLLQFNLFNSSSQYGIPDFISLYDGDIYNVTATVIDRITTTSRNEKKLFRTKMPSLSVKLFANGASSEHGFIAEIVTLPISAIGFNRDVQHNISTSIINNNRQGGIMYMTAGEVNPIVTIEKNQFKSNCKQLYGNFTTCKSAVIMDVQNTQTIFFRNNLVEQNQGGLYIKADSRGSATSLQGYIHNNLFVKNMNLPVLYVEGRQSSPYQEVTIYRNYFTRNYAQYHNNIVLRQVVSNFTLNYVKRNVGQQNFEVSGFDRVRLNIYQTTTHNGFYNNYALHRDSRSTIVAGTAGQHYVDNIFFDPDNDYEMITVNRSLFEFNSTLQLWNTKIDAANNYWGFNTTLAVRGRIRDQSDDPKLLEVMYEPYHMNNKSILNGKCPPGWDLVGETCYMYIGAPMTFRDAKKFCQADNASIPYLIGNTNYLYLYDFLKRQQQWYLFSDRVWVQHIDKISECTWFAYQNVELGECEEKHPFLCEIDPKVSIKILPMADDSILIAVISSCSLAIILLIIVIVFWWSKSKFRKAQRLERRNSIRQSLHSLRSVGLSSANLSDAKRKQYNGRSTDTLNKSMDYRKIMDNGSIDSMEKSNYSSNEDTQSFGMYEPKNPNPSNFAYTPTLEYHRSPYKAENQYDLPRNLAFKNEGFRDNSTFASNSNYQSRSESAQDSTNDEVPIINTNGNGISYPPSEYYTNDTLPLSKSSSKLVDNNYGYDPSYSRERPNPNILSELKSRLPQPQHSPTSSDRTEDTNYTTDYNTVGLAQFHDRPHSDFLETDFDEPVPKPKMRSKSEALLETNFDDTPPGSPQFGHPLTDTNRSKSQPLETAM